MADQASQGLLSAWLQRRRIRAALPHLRGRVLDVGCGNGGLAAHIAPERYLGWDRDRDSIDRARALHPDHSFATAAPTGKQGFDTVVSLAVIEHVPSSAAFLRQMADNLVAGGRIVVTTPHPAFDFVHTAGASVGLFSRHASEEHEQLLDRAALAAAGAEAGLAMVYFRRFLLGANQLAVFEPR